MSLTVPADGLIAARWRRLKMSAKLSVALVVIAVLGFLVGGPALFLTIYPAFERLEADAVERQHGQAEALLAGYLETMQNSATDYGVWDDSFDYIATRDPAFETETLQILNLVNVGVDASAYVSFAGDLIQARYIDRAAEVDLPEMTGKFGALVTGAHYIAAARAKPAFAEFVFLDGRLLSLGVAQVLRSDGSGPAAGYMVFAREITDAAASEALQTAATITATVAAAPAVRQPDAWRVAAPIRSFDGPAIGSLEFSVPRSVSALGRTSILLALAVAAVVIAGILVAAWLSMRAIAVRRLAAIDRHMRRTAETGELEPLPSDPRADELAALALAFNDMVAQIRELRERNEHQSFQLGQNEAMAGVLHNLRNSLNPVSVILSQAVAERAPFAGADVARAARELAEEATPAERRDRLAKFLAAAVAEADRQAESRRESLLTARTSLAEAVEILSARRQAKETPLDSFDIMEVVRRNAALGRFAPSGQIDLDLPAGGARVHANRLLASQVIANLVTNAVESIVAAGRRPGHLSVSLAETDDTVAVTIADDGRGFAPAEGARLFERGYTTKKSRAGGLGLHWCANTMNAMGGRLALASDGPGCGARAVVTFRKAATAAAARPPAPPPSGDAPAPLALAG